MLARGFFELRRSAIASVTAVAFSLFSTGTALANTPLIALAETSTLPAPTSLALYEPTDAPLQTQSPAPSDAVAVDAPSHVPAPAPAGLGKVVLFVLAVVGIAVLVLLIVGAVALYDLITNNE